MYLLIIVGSILGVRLTAQHNKALHEEKEAAERYLSGAEVMRIAFDTAESITLLNRKGYEILGYLSGEFDGKNGVQSCIPKEVQVYSFLLSLFPSGPKKRGKVRCRNNKSVGSAAWRDAICGKPGGQRLHIPV